MKMKKIKGIEKNICTCEQKIAYNYAFSYHDILKKIHNSDKAYFIKKEKYDEIIMNVISSIKNNRIDKKYNIDAIIHCFRNGIENYLNYNNSGILGSYEEIGKIFTSLYEIK